MNGIMVIVCFGVGWAISQALKLIVYMIKKPGKESFSEMVGRLMKSGGMPSSHAASFGAVVWYLGLTMGFTSEMFALALCMYIIVLYDAVNVRYAVGEQGKVLKRLVGVVPEKLRERVTGVKGIEIVEGHTVLQVTVGAVIGAVVAFVASVLV